MVTFHVYGDNGQQEIEADSLKEVIERIDIPSDEEIEDGAWLVIRNEETMESKEWGKRPQ